MNLGEKMTISVIKMGLFLVTRMVPTSFVKEGPKLGVHIMSPLPKKAKFRPAERPNGHLPENQSYPELPQDMGDL